VRAVGSVLEPGDVAESMKSMAHAPHDERLRIVSEREQLCGRIATSLRAMKDRVSRKDELLQGYEKDLAKLRSVFSTSGSCGGLDPLRNCAPGHCRGRFRASDIQTDLPNKSLTGSTSCLIKLNVGMWRGLELIRCNNSGYSRNSVCLSVWSQKTDRQIW